MPENLKTLRRRIRSIRTTKQITRAMEMVSAAKLRRSQQEFHAAQPYASRIQAMLERLAASPETATHPLFARRSTEGAALLVVVASDRGLCGSYNVNLFRAAESWIRARGTAPTDLFCIGRKTLDHFRRARSNIVGELVNLGGKVSSERTHELVDQLTRAFLEGRYNSIHIVYAHFVSNILNRPRVVQFLPLESDMFSGKTRSGVASPSTGLHVSGSPIHRSGESGHSYLMEPSPSAVFTALLPQFLISTLYTLLAESFAAEHSARMMAMNNATNNCSELGDALTLRMNKARQAAITKEMLEIVGGADALKS